MRDLVANPTAFSYLTARVEESANVGLPACNYGGGRGSSFGVFGGSNVAALAMNFRSRGADEDVAPAWVCRSYPVLESVTASRLFMRPAALGLLLWLTTPSRNDRVPGTPDLRHPLGFGSSQKLCAGSASANFSGPAEKADLRPWEHGPSLGFALCDPIQIGKINETEAPVMYQNKVNLIGFLGSDAEVHTANNRSFTTLSLAT